MNNLHSKVSLSLTLLPLLPKDFWFHPHLYPTKGKILPTPRSQPIHLHPTLDTSLTLIFLPHLLHKMVITIIFPPTTIITRTVTKRVQRKRMLLLLELFPRRLDLLPLPHHLPFLCHVTNSTVRTTIIMSRTTRRKTWNKWTAKENNNWIPMDHWSNLSLLPKTVVLVLVLLHHQTHQVNITLNPIQRVMLMLALLFLLYYQL